MKIHTLRVHAFIIYLLVGVHGEKHHYLVSLLPTISSDDPTSRDTLLLL